MLTPNKKNILVDPTDALKKTKAGHFLPDKEKRANEGTVIAVGEEVTFVKPGDYVYFSEFIINGRELKQEDKLYVVIKEDEILVK